MRRIVGAAFMAVLAVVAAGCGGSGSSSGGGTTTGTTEATAGKVATGTPIKIGFVNTEGSGPVSLPEIGDAISAAEKYVNTQLGGIDGQPIQYVRCATDGSPEKSIDCANKLVEADVAYVQNGLDIGSDAALAIYRSAGIPFIGHAPAGEKQQTAKGVYLLGMAGPASAAAPLKYFSEQGEESVVWFQLDIPAGHQYIEANVEPVAKQLGVKVTPIYYPPENADWTALAATAMSDSPEVIAISGLETTCIGLIGALKTAGYDGTVFASTCSAFVEALKSAAAGVIRESDIWLPGGEGDVPKAKQEELAAYEKAMTEGGFEKEINASLAPAYFADTVTMARILEGVSGPITPASVTKAMNAAVDVDSFIGPEISCDGSAWPGQSACGNQALLYETQANGKQKEISEGFIDVSEFATGG